MLFAVQTLKAFLSRIGLFKDCKGLLLNLKVSQRRRDVWILRMRTETERNCWTRRNKVWPNIHISFLLLLNQWKVWVY